MPDRKPSTVRILKNDYASLLMLMAIGIAWLICLFTSVFGFLPKNRHGSGGQEVDNTFISGMWVVAILVTGLFAYLASRRIAMIKRVIATGQEVKGRILGIGFEKDRGRIDYEYVFENQTYQSGNAIWKNKETTCLQAGDEVILIIDPDKPTRAFMASLYSTD